VNILWRYWSYGVRVRGTRAAVRPLRLEALEDRTCPSGNANPFNSPTFQVEVQQLMASNNFPQISIAAELGNVPYTYTYTNPDYTGFSAGSLPTTTANSLFRVASISKPMTAAAIMLLVQDGLLHLSDRAFQVLGFFDAHGNPVPLSGYDPVTGKAVTVLPSPALYGVTIQSLLNMSSGLPQNMPVQSSTFPNAPNAPVIFTGGNYAALSFAGAFVSPPYQGPPASAYQQIRYYAYAFTKNQMSLSGPGTYAYSDTGYAILGAVAETLSEQLYGLSYPQYLQQYILGPMGISAPSANPSPGTPMVGLAHTLQSQAYPTEVEYYPDADESPTPSVFPNPNATAPPFTLSANVPQPYGGGIYYEGHFGEEGMTATPLALVDFFNNLYAAYNGATTGPLSPATVQQMVSFANGTSTGSGSWYGLGWQVIAAPGTTTTPGIWSKNGSDPGTSSWLTQFTDGTTWSYLLNEDINLAQGVGGQSFVTSLSQDVQSALYGTQVIDTGLSYPSGFANSSANLTLNGDAKIVGSALQLTNGTTGQVSSVFSNMKIGVGSFTTQFSFQLLNAKADGFAFVIQGLAATALGPGGGGLGYGGPGGIPNSLAIKFDLYSNAGEGDDSTGLFLNGAAPTNQGSVNLSKTGINLHSGHVFNVAMAYNGTTLKVIITDTVTGATASHSYAVNIPGIVGGNAAYVGFTGGSGGLTATQNILSWTYTPLLVTPPAPVNVTAAASLGRVSLRWTASAGALSYNIYRSTTSNGEGSTPFKTGVAGTSFIDTTAANGTTYYYEASAVGIAGESALSTEVPATPPLPAIDLSSGFAGAGGQLKVNKSAKINGSFLQLTNGGGGEAGSAFSSTPLDVTQFATQFSFQLLNANADGFTFCIQGVGPTALGLTGGGLGYGPQRAGGTGGISNSVAIKFDLYSNQGEGNDSTGLFLNGAAPTNVGSVNLSNTGINLHSGHVFNATITYNGSVLNVTITDTVTGASATQSYTVNIPSSVGGNTAYVGFTGGTGGLTADQRILKWVFATKPSAPSGLTAVAGNGQVALSWSASPGATDYNIYRSTTSGGEGATPVSTGVTSTSFTDTGLTAGTTYFYQITAVNAVGESAKSNEVSSTPTALNFSTGFAGASSRLTLNGSANVNGSALQLTDGGSTESASAFSTSAVNVSSFSTQFSFQLQGTTNPGADGFTFCIQGVVPTALGLSGGGLGYGTDAPGDSGGIANSVTVKFKLYSTIGEGNDSTGLLTNGEPPTTTNSIDLSNTGINLNSGDDFNVTMTYDGTTLNVTITDTVTQATASQSYAVNIPSLVGGNTAFVGFTGGTGGLTAVQKILNWSYSPT
jgi:CubicO group peptidase (beta-lactamase class C family)